VLHGRATPADESTAADARALEVSPAAM